jgi:uncharacterized protein (TIGR03435 family)
MNFEVSPGGRLTVSNWDLELLVQQAYGVRPHQIFGGPRWGSVDRYDITAKADGEATRARILEMLRTLLEDRFKPRSTASAKAGFVYRLVVSKGGRA